jgi:replicative DNA helicase
MSPHDKPKSKDTAPYGVPPQNIEAEESIISAILIDNDALLDVIEALGPEDFYRTAHQKIYTAITDLFDKAEPVDLVTLANKLKEKGELEAVGGASYLARLVDTVPLAVNARHYAKIVHDKASLRRMIEKANAIIKRCFEERGEAEDVIDFAESAVFEISEQKARQSFYPLSKIILGNIETLEEKQGNRSLVTGVTTGFTQLDTMTSGLQNADLIILAARPSMGKTALALNIARNAAVDAGVPVAVFSLEMSKEQLSLRMLCSEARIDSSRLRGGFFSMEDWHRLTEAAGTLSECPIYIDDSPSLSAMEIRAKARRLKMDKNIGLVIIDYLQLMQGRSSAERRDLEISEISRGLKALAKELDLPVMALSQLNRMLEQRTDKRPRLSDLRESGALEQDADVVAFIYRDEVYNKEEDNPNRGTAEILL